MMNISKGLFTLFTVVGLAACSGVQIEGSWIEPVPGMPEMVQGVTLENGGGLLPSIWPPCNMSLGRKMEINWCCRVKV